MCLLSTKFIVVFIVIWSKFIPAQVYLRYPDKMRFVSCGNLFHVFYFVFWKISSITVPGKVFISKIPPVSKQDLTKFVNAEAWTGGPCQILGACQIFLQFLWESFQRSFQNRFEFLWKYPPTSMYSVSHFQNIKWGEAGNGMKLCTCPIMHQHIFQS